MRERGRRTRRGVLAAGAGTLAALAGCSSLNLNHRSGGKGGGANGEVSNASGIAVRVKPTGSAVSDLSKLPVTVSSVGIHPRGQNAGRLSAGNTVDLLANGGKPVEFFVLGFPTGKFVSLTLYGHAGTATTTDGSSAPAAFAGGSGKLEYDVNYRLVANQTTVVTAAVDVETNGNGGYALSVDANATSVSKRSGRPSTTTR